MTRQSNPFYNNYVFSNRDISRAVIKRWQYPLLWLLPTYVQLADGYAFHFKMWQGRVYLMKMDRFADHKEG